MTISGTPVEWNAVLTSPQGIDMTVTEPVAKSAVRRRHPAGTDTIRPSTRARPPEPMPSTAVRAVPGLRPPPARNAMSSAPASGSRSTTIAARQSVGTTSKPLPGSRATPALACLAVAGEDRLQHVDLAGDVQVVHARGQARVHHRPRGGGERPGAVGDRLDPGEGGPQPRGVGERERPVLETQPGAELGERTFVATRQHGSVPAAARPAPRPAGPCSRWRRRSSTSRLRG